MGAFAPGGTTMLLACKLKDLPATIPEEKKHLIPIMSMINSYTM